MNQESRLSLLGRQIIDNKETIAHAVTKSLSTPLLSPFTDQEIHAYRTTFIDLIGHSFEASSFEASLERASKWGRAMGEMASQQEVSLDDAMLTVPRYRKALCDFIEATFEGEHHAFSFYATLSNRLNQVIDQVLYAFTQSYIAHYENMFLEAKQRISELSIPIVPLIKEVAILPLLGTLDSDRAKLLVSNVMVEASERELEYLLIDLSGVYEMDRISADYFCQLYEGLQLLGIQVIVTGVHPDLVQSMRQANMSANFVNISQTILHALAVIGYSLEPSPS